MPLRKLELGLLLINSLQTLAGSGADAGMNLNYGITYPDQSLAARESASVLAILGGDRIGVLTDIPLKNDPAQPIANDKRTDKDPIWISYGGNPKPFGLGVSVTTGKQPEFFASGACGTDKIQLGYTYHDDPQTQVSSSTYSARLGEKNGHALTIMWGDEKRALGIGFIFGWLVFELDVQSDLTFSKDPQPSAAIGMQNEHFGINAGYRADNFKDKHYTKDKVFGGIFYKSGKNFAINLYYQEFIAQYSAEISLIL